MSARRSSKRGARQKRNSVFLSHKRNASEPEANAAGMMPRVDKEALLAEQAELEKRQRYKELREKAKASGSRPNKRRKSVERKTDDTESKEEPAKKEKEKEKGNKKDKKGNKKKDESPSPEANGESSGKKGKGKKRASKSVASGDASAANGDSAGKRSKKPKETEKENRLHQKSPSRRQRSKRSTQMESVAEDMKDSEYKPFFLQGNFEKRGGSAEQRAKMQRSQHQRKKDYKTTQALRKAEEVEKEWLGKYAELHPGGTLDGAEVDWGDISVAICVEMLVTLHESWEGRIMILETLAEQLLAEETSAEHYYVKMCKFLFAIRHQFTDPRSLIIQAMRDVIGRVARESAPRFIDFAPYVMESLYPAIPVRIEALREAAVECQETIVEACMQVDKPEHRLFHVIMDGLSYKHRFTRTCCAACLIDFLKTFDPFDEKTDEAFVDKVDTTVRLAVTDATVETRLNGYRALHLYRRLAPKRAEIIICGMSKAVRRKFDSAGRRGSLG